MALTRKEFLEKLLKGYEACYDVTPAAPEQEPLMATAFFHVHNAGYFLVKKAESWSADSHEYLYVFSVPVLDGVTFKKCIEIACEDGMPRIQPGKNHMSSFITAVILCDECTPDGELLLRKYRNRKSFQFSLHGWMEVHTAAVNLGKGTVSANHPNAESVKYLKNVLRGRRRGILNKLRVIL